MVITTLAVPLKNTENCGQGLFSTGMLNISFGKGLGTKGKGGQSIADLWRPFTFLVNVRLPFILRDVHRTVYSLNSCFNRFFIAASIPVFLNRRDASRYRDLEAFLPGVELFLIAHNFLNFTLKKL